MFQKLLAGGLLSLLFFLPACKPADEQASNSTGAPETVVCDPDNGGLTLPEGFCAVVVSDSVGFARHLAVSDNGDVYVALRQVKDGGGLVALRDANADGKADSLVRFSEFAGTGIAYAKGFLYVAADTAIVRYPLPAGQLTPTAPFEVIAGGFPAQSFLSAKSIALDQNNGLYVNVGAPSDNCLDESNPDAKKGIDPCPQTERQAGIWKFAADQQGQTQQAAKHYATGIRNSVALAWSPGASKLYAAEHARDGLSMLWPDLYNDEQNAELPSEQLIMVEEGRTYSWPYCYYDEAQKTLVLSPDYGGDGKKVDRCSQYPKPVLGFPGHYAPNGMAFYTGNQFPQKYHNGLFVAFHGSWNRAPLEQKGYNIVFLPFSGDQASGPWEVFADGFAGVPKINGPGDAHHRPVGVAVGPDGSLYVSDSVKGKIWRIIYRAEQQP